MNTFFLTSLAKAINTYIGLDPESKGRIQKLTGKIISFELLPIHFKFQCIFNDAQIEIQTGDLLPAETKIRGTPLQLLNIIITKDNRHRFFADDVVIEGNAELGQQVIALFDELEIDWEEQISKVVGDVPAYHLGQSIRHIKKWLQNTEHSFTANVDEYLHEELAWLPAREALQDLFADIDSLRMDIDRLEARILRLKQNLHDDHKELM